MNKMETTAIANTTELNTKNYHNIIIPLDDIYSLGGPETFDNLQSKEAGKTNLVVMPPHVFNTLKQKQSENDDYGATKTAEAIDFLKDKIVSTNNNVTIYHINESLDFALLHVTNDLKFLNYNKLKDEIERKFRADKGIEFITNNTFERINLRNYGLNVTESEFLLAGLDYVKKGIITTSNPKLQTKLFQAGKEGLPLDKVSKYFDEELYINQFIHIQGEDGKFKYARVTCDLIKKSGKILSYDNARVILLDEDEYGMKLKIGDQKTTDILGIKPLDMEQYLSLQYGLLNPDVSLLFLTGGQGSGKTVLSYVAAIDQILQYDQKDREARRSEHGLNLFDKIVLLKPTNIMGGKERDIGFLPGNMFEKVKPHIAPYIDSHNESLVYKTFPFEEMLRHPKYVNDYGGPRIDHKNLMDNTFKIGRARLPNGNEAIEMTYSGYARGRTFKYTFYLIDEAQNYTPYEMKTLIERAGIGTKIIVMGDPQQIDNPKCTRDINGLTHAIKHYLQFPYSCLVNLKKNYRSPMSEDAASWKVYSQ
jgi:PhoH-like ATPase